MKLFYPLFFISFLFLRVHCMFNSLLNRYYCENENCYHILGIKETASEFEIKRSYNEKIRSLNFASDIATIKKIKRAYTILTNKRSKLYYDYYLKNPTSVLNILYFYLLWFYKILYSVCITLLVLCVLSFCQYMHNKFKIKHVFNRCVHSKVFKRELKNRIDKAYPNFRKLDSKEQKQIEASIGEKLAQEIVVVNNERIRKIQLRELLIVRFFQLPHSVYKYIIQWLRWILMYTILRREYSDADKEYLTRKRLNMSQREWDSLITPVKRSHIRKQLWIKENFQKYVEDQKEIERINRITSSKYKIQMRQKKKGVSFNYND